ncbi:YbaK/prolyl-tRNA synthetase associated domain-containing protein [Streptomyces sp. NBC_00249]|uniref:YbaK/EbsC family protein n=1 Tax=Streptomyces sp. NBC_00249 TaxID=2975690 RepID=UPI00224CC824|nr:YbaK/EbsC family protein [Streptomyces sp. NBC_00249]MCX5198664.1 YbaK/prolyl-tRNA synthetase associated domain-containing protein [Streptomyces sp. NBC_00249]
MTSATAIADSYARLIDLLAGGGADYRLLRHAPEGRTELATLIRGHRLEQAAKCMVIRVALGRKKRRYVIAVVPGHRRVDLDAVRDEYGGTKASFAVREVAEELTGCASGSIMPVSFDPSVEVVVDPDLLEHDEIWFNAGRLDESVALSTASYVALVRPRAARISEVGALLAVGG